MSSWLYHAALGGAIRVTESFFAAGPTLLVGLLIAAVFRFYLGPQGVKRLFGGDSLKSLPQSWAVGMLMPVCSIGVLPVLVEMRRSRVKPGALFAFALSAPLFNPLSLLYGLTLSRPYVIIMFAIGSLAVVTIVGLAWDWFATRNGSEDSAEPIKTSDVIGVRRLMMAMVYICRQLCGPAGGWMLVGTLGMFLLAAALPWGSLQSGLNRDDWWAPARMASVAMPVYATPMMVMSQIGAMFQHANSPGAAFILLVVGAGVNLATIVWLMCQFGLRKTVVWFSCLMIVVVSIAYAVNRPLIPPGVDPVEHSHAFDIYTNPLHRLDSPSGKHAIEKLGEKFGLVEKITLSTLGLIAGLGLIFRLIGWEGELKARRIDDDQEAPDETYELASWDRPVGPQVIGATLLSGMVALSVVMCYAYYPSTEECLEEVLLVRGNMVSGARSGDAEFALFWIPRYDEWTRRLEVGTFLRRGEVTPYQRMQGYLIRKKLETLEHELGHDHGDSQVIWDTVNDLEETYSRWVRAFRNLPVTTVTRASPEEVVVDHQVDSEHDHRHFHDDDQSHDHHHDGFQGGHEHNHLHPHRHDDAPHGGQIVNLGHDRHQSTQANLHLEVMPIRDGKIVIYLLKEQLGILRPSGDEMARLVLHLRPITSDGSKGEELINEPEWNGKDHAFQDALILEHQNTSQFAVFAEYHDGDILFQSPFFNLSIE